MFNVYTLAVAVTLGLGIAAIAIAVVGSKALQAIARQPEASNKVQAGMILPLVFAEGLGILSFVLGLLLLNK